MDQREELAALRRMAELEAKAAGPKAEAETPDPTSGMGTFEKLVAGYGSGMPRIARGVQQRRGAMSQAEVDEANKADKPLLNTTAGMAGNVLGTVVPLALTALIPGAGSLLGASAIGGATGYFQPTSTGESVGHNSLMGAAAGPLGVLGGRAIGAAFQGGKALLEPLFQKGQERIAGRTLERFAENPSAIQQAVPGPTMTGANPTLAEATGDRGLAQLQDTLGASGNPAIANQLAARATANNGARVNALQTLAGDGGARDAAATLRGTTARQLYGDAAANATPIGPAQAKGLYDLVQAPAIKQAMKIAQTNAEDRGVPFDVGSVGSLHDMKLALDGMMKDPKNAGQASTQDALKAAQQRLVGFIETVSPDYKKARESYAAMSKPVNSFDVAAQVAKRGLTTTTDLSGNQTINRGGLTRVMADEPALIKDATGRSLGKLADVMKPADEAMLRAIVAEADRAGAVSSAGIGKGSPTAQRLATQNLLNQTFSAVGLPSKWAESTAAQTILKPLNMLYGGVAEPKIQQILADAVLDPAKAKALMTAATPAQRPALLSLLQRSAGTRSATLANRP